MKWLIFFPLLFSFFVSSLNFELLGRIYDSLVGERCADSWFFPNIDGLKEDLQQTVFGQPFLENSLLPVLKKHISAGASGGSGPKKALVLSFHGSPGVGKTYVSQIIANNLYKNGVKSKYYKFFSMTDSWETDSFQKYIRKTVKETVEKCERAMFVFDEVEKMPNSAIDIIKTFLDFHSHVGNVDYRKSIFIFISNIALQRINALTLSLWRKGIDRKNFQLADFERALFEPAYNEEGGLKKTAIVRNYLIDMYLPFLPLEKEHVKKCIIYEAVKLKQAISNEKIEIILRSLEFLPPAENLYSSSGCKNIHPYIFRYGTSHDEL